MMLYIARDSESSKDFTRDRDSSTRMKAAMRCRIDDHSELKSWMSYFI